MDFGGAAPCLFLVIGFIFMVTAPYNWHATLLTNACTAEVPLDQENLKPLFGMLTHAAFFIGELNWSIASIHLMDWLGFEPALAAAPVIVLISSGIVKIKLGKGGPTGLPIHGPPAPVPQLAILLGLVVFANAVHACASGGVKRAPGPNDLAEYAAGSAVILGVPHLLSQYHLATSPWTGAPISREKRA